ncbi:hypothetical protein [Flavobacterium sp.]|uniref:hypothetical protein n=1 Tax=Flavobacterium sp. TaxID=239 RepID=UPI002488BA63|nr:hypothetical protein [Flavobacterium sp.]MDI1318457.1 hypothetical protein [Flavobacterium sp.]
MRNLLLILPFLFLSCNRESQIPENSRIDMKYIVFSPGMNNITIADTSKLHDYKFENNMDYGFRLENKLYDMEYRIKLDEKGRLLGLLEYKNINSPIYKIIKKFPMNYETIAEETFIRFSPSRENVIDGLDTMTIEKVFPKQKLVRVGTDKNIRNYFYHYK